MRASWGPFCHGQQPLTRSVSPNRGAKAHQVSMGEELRKAFLMLIYFADILEILSNTAGTSLLGGMEEVGPSDENKNKGEMGGEVAHGCRGPVVHRAKGTHGGPGRRF